MDGLEERGQVIVIGATNRVDAIDPALRRGGRFDREIGSASPTRVARKSCRSTPAGCPLAEGSTSTSTPRAPTASSAPTSNKPTKESAMNALRRIRPELDLESDEIDAEVLERLEVSEDDFKRTR